MTAWRCGARGRRARRLDVRAAGLVGRGSRSSRRRRPGRRRTSALQQPATSPSAGHGRAAGPPRAAWASPEHSDVGHIEGDVGGALRARARRQGWSCRTVCSASVSLTSSRPAGGAGRTIREQILHSVPIGCRAGGTEAAESGHAAACVGAGLGPRRQPSKVRAAGQGAPLRHASPIPGRLLRKMCWTEAEPGCCSRYAPLGRRRSGDVGGRSGATSSERQASRRLAAGQGAPLHRASPIPGRLLRKMCRAEAEPGCCSRYAPLGRRRSGDVGALGGRSGALCSCGPCARAPRPRVRGPAPEPAAGRLWGVTVVSYHCAPGPPVYSKGSGGDTRRRRGSTTSDDGYQRGASAAGAKNPGAPAPRAAPRHPTQQRRRAPKPGLETRHHLPTRRRRGTDTSQQRGDVGTARDGRAGPRSPEESTPAHRQHGPHLVI